jgi:hypothetical protein
LKTSQIIFWIIGLFIAFLILYILKETFSQPGMERFEGKYELIDQIRNENNTGPIIRVYAVKALDLDPTWMRAFADAQPHTKYGKTIVFFFAPETDLNFVQISLKSPYLDPKSSQRLLYKYEKLPMSDVKWSSDLQQK